MRIHRKLELCFGLALVLTALVALPGSVDAQVVQQPQAVCQDDAVRQQFAADVAAGGPVPGAIYTTCSGSTYYEEIYNCGYHPQAEVVSCPIEIKRNTYYGPFGSDPAGSFEYVYFCFDCNQDGIWDYETLGFVHTTDNNSTSSPSWWLEAHATTFDAPRACTIDNGTATTVQATLSWSQRPTGCNFVPVWGNTIIFQTRKDP